MKVKPIDSSNKELLIQRIVGAKIRELRQSRHMLAVDLAEREGISPSQLSR